MKHIRWQVSLGLILISLSVLFYTLHYVIFKDVHHIFIYLIGDIAFVPIEVLLVTLIIHRLLDQREKGILMQKLNMVIGTFFSEVGNGLLLNFLNFNNNGLKGDSNLVVNADWSDKDFNEAVKHVPGLDMVIEAEHGDLKELKAFLIEKRVFLLRLLENQNLLEHDTFTELLWSVFHLLEELDARGSFDDLPENDRKHLEVDVRRAYGYLVSEWLDYMKHLKNNYPYLFSLAVRTNVFKEEPSAEFE